MSTLQNRQFKLTSRPVGMVKRSDFEFVTTPAGEPEMCIRDRYCPPILRSESKTKCPRGRYRDGNQLIEDALRRSLDWLHREEGRVQALRRVAQAVDEAGLYTCVLMPDRE